MAKSKQKAPKLSLVSALLRHGVTRVVFLALVLLLLLVQLVFDVLVYKHYIGYDGGPVIITEDIIRAAEGFVHRPLVDAPTGKVYFPDARIMLSPARGTYRELSYAFTTSGDSQNDAELMVTYRQYIDISESRLLNALSLQQSRHSSDPSPVFDAVPELQACVRGVHVLFDGSNVKRSGYILQSTVPLKDGRTAYVATEKNSQCHQDFSGLVALLSQAQNY